MKRYLAFYMSRFYLSGGWEDFIGDFDSQEQAVTAIHTRALEEKNPNDSSMTEKEWQEYHWRYHEAHVVDLETKTIVYNIYK